MIRHSAKDQLFLRNLTDITLANMGNEAFGVCDLAQQAGLSRDRLSKKLQLLTNKTIKQFIREIRLRKAFELLRNEDLTASEVAYKVGFGSPTYFNTCFTEFFGHPPGSVRKGDIDISENLIGIPADPEKTQKRYLSRPIIQISALFILILSILVYIYFFKPAAVKTALSIDKPEQSIAVLPFKNLSDSAGNQYFVDGIAEDILTLLSRVHDLRVISRTSVEQFRNSKMSTSDIARKLKVRYIVEGSVQKSGSMFRLWIQLIDAASGEHLWAEVYDGKYSTDIFDFQSRIAKKVAASLDVVIAPKEEKRINNNPTKEIQAYELCLKGEELVRKWYLSGDEQYLKLSINAFDNALKIDPDYVSALLGMAHSLLKSGSYDSSIVYNRRVLDIDKENISALVGIGGYYLYTNIPDSALRYFQMSIEADPNGAKTFWSYLGTGQVFFMYRNEVVKAFSSYQKAYDVGGYAWPEIHDNISLLFSSIGDYSKAFKYMHNSLSMTSSCSYIRKSFYILLSEGKYDEAPAFIDSIGRITPCEQICDIMRFYLYTTQKDYEKAELFLKKAIKSGYKLEWDDYMYKSCLYEGTSREKEDYTEIKNIVEREERVLKERKSFWTSETALRAAAGYSILGDKKKALVFIRLLEKCGCYDNPFPLNTFPGFDKIRSDPEFKAVLKSIEEHRDSLRAEVKMMELNGDLKL